MNSGTSPRTRRALASPFRPGYVHPAGSEVTLLEPIDPEHRVWIVELRVPDEDLVGGAWYDHAELPITDIDFTSELEEDMRTADNAEPTAPHKEPSHVEDVALALGSR